MDKGKPWTQRGLAKALNLESNQTIWELETKDTELEFERRQFLCRLFDIPPVLLGIITLDEIDKSVKQQGAVQTPIVVGSTPVAISHKLLIDVEEYTALLDNYWTTYIRNPTQLSMTNIDLCIDALYRELPHVREKKPIQELLCRFHDLAAILLGDQQQEYDEALVQLEKAWRFAQLLNKDELKVLVLYDYGITLSLAGRLDKAVQKYKQARRYEQRLPRNLEDSLLLETGRAEAQDAETQDQKDAAIALVDQVGNHLRSRSKRIAEDPYFLDLDLDRYHLTRSFALIAVGRNKDALGELELVKAGPERPRRQANKDIFQAQALTNLGEYSEAADFAASGLVVAQESNSEINIARVERMYKQFPRDLFKHDDDVARLEYLLSKRRKTSKR